MTEIKKLWQLTSHRVKFPAYDGNDGIPQPNVPSMLYPDGSVCWPLTFYLCEIYRKSRSNRGSRGGSAGTVASQLSLFHRFCCEKKLNFCDITDGYLEVFKDHLANEGDLANPSKLRRNSTTVGGVIRTALHFLVWFQDWFLIKKDLIGETSSCFQITVTYKINKRTGKKSIGHFCIPVEATPKRRNAIASHLIDDLIRACHKTQSIFRRERKISYIKLLECTGGRRVEVAHINADDITEALATGELKLYTAKNRKNPKRVIPVDPEWLEPIHDYIVTVRKRLVDDLIKRKKISKDPGHLFLSTSGVPLKTETFTKELSLLRKIAGISEEACSHMFRHRFITLQIMKRVKHYANPQSIPVDILELILNKVSALTGSSPGSLRPYIHDTFEEMGVWDNAEESLRIYSKARAALHKINTIRHQIEEGLIAKELVVEMCLNVLNNVVLKAA